MKRNRDDWLQAGFECLVEEGIEAVRVEPLAERLGVTKGSFYGYFGNRAEFHRAILERWSVVATGDVIRRVEAVGAGSSKRLAELVRIAAEGFDGRAELALRQWAERDPHCARVVTQVDRRRMAFLSQLYRESGVGASEAEGRALLTYSLLFGGHLLPEAHGRFSRRRVLAECFALLGVEDASAS